MYTSVLGGAITDIRGVSPRRQLHGVIPTDAILYKKIANVDHAWNAVNVHRMIVPSTRMSALRNHGAVVNYY
eukprot:COSAG01_NODE_8247_length_2858_cov_1.254078_1_plen_72_part_00